MRIKRPIDEAKDARKTPETNSAVPRTMTHLRRKRSAANPPSGTTAAYAKKKTEATAPMRRSSTPKSARICGSVAP